MTSHLYTLIYQEKPLALFFIRILFTVRGRCVWGVRFGTVLVFVVTEEVGKIKFILINVLNTLNYTK